MVALPHALLIGEELTIIKGNGSLCGTQTQIRLEILVA